MGSKILYVSFQDSAMQMWGGFLMQTISLYTQLLDCFGIPVLMALSWFVLRARYRLIHFLAVAVCLLGVGTMVGADILAGRQDSEGKESFIAAGEEWRGGCCGGLTCKGERRANAGGVDIVFF